MSDWMLLLAAIGTLAIFATTRPGRELAKRIGLRDHVAGAAPSEDVAFLLKACDGDRDEVERRLAVERSLVSELEEAEHYRRAIRKILAQRED
jgi:hypothetical protein